MRRGGLLITIVATTIIYGCGSSAPQNVPVPQDPDTPRTVTDLGSISSAPLSQFKQGSRLTQGAFSEEARAAFARSSETTREVGDDKHPDSERLLNQKATEFGVMSTRIMDQVLVAVNQIEDEGEISKIKLPTQLKPVIITATLDHSGKLRELVIDQHSGQAAVDNTFIEACRRGLYFANPPPDAATADGSYKMRVEGSMQNWASLDDEHWEFKTSLGLALL